MQSTYVNTNILASIAKKGNKETKGCHQRQPIKSEIYPVQIEYSFKKGIIVQKAIQIMSRKETLTKNISAKKKHHILRNILIVFLSIIALFAIGIGAYNGIKHIRFKGYYEIATRRRDNPGLNDGYVTQGLCYLEDEDRYLTSGYRKDKKSPSRVYSVDKDNKQHYAELYFIKDGAEKKFTYHCGGVASEGDYVYVASASKIFSFKKSDILNSNKAVAVKSFSVNCAASFVFTDGQYLYTGEFNDGNAYKTNNTFTNTDGETTKAIISKYNLSDVNEKEKGIPVLEYAIRNSVQGRCVTASGKIVLDTSWGRNPSHFYVYDGFQDKIDTKDKDVPVIYLDSRYLKQDIVGPSRAEDLDYHNGKVLVASESASNKYIYGKLFFYFYINGLTID